MLNIFDWIRGRSPIGQTATELYGSIVAQSRQPAFYTGFGIADVAEKRYELIVLHIVLVLERLRASETDGMVIAQTLIETFISDLDGSIREMAVGDTKVPAKVKKAAGGLLDRDVLYRQAFAVEDSPETGDGSPGDVPDASDDAEVLTVRNLIAELVFDGARPPGALALYRYVRAARSDIAGWTLQAGVPALTFPNPDDFVGEVQNGSAG